MKFIVSGGKVLNGEINLSGAKNVATKMLVASLLTDEECVFSNFPNIGDTQITMELCRQLGSTIDFRGSNLSIRTEKLKTSRVISLTRKNRIPILALGPLLARSGEAEVPILGGDAIGPRPVDFHLQALRAMGADLDVSSSGYLARAPEGLRGANIVFPYPSVGATENTILAAVLAEGKTFISNAATEPEIMELVKMLQKMGAIIEIGTNRKIYIEGVSRLRGAYHGVMPDRNEAVSFACLALATGSRIKILGAIQDHLVTFLNNIRRCGGEYEIDDNGITFWRSGNLRDMRVETDTHPGFMTDWQQPFAIVLTQADGNSVIHETVYEDRFGYMEDLRKLGASAEVVTECLGVLPCRFKGMNFKHSAIIHGPAILKSSNLTVRDLRSGIAHLVALLTSRGESVIDGIEEIDRGYENIDERLKGLGAEIQRIN